MRNWFFFRGFHGAGASLGTFTRHCVYHKTFESSPSHVPPARCSCTGSKYGICGWIIDSQSERTSSRRCARVLALRAVSQRGRSQESCGWAVIVGTDLLCHEMGQMSVGLWRSAAVTAPAAGEWPTWSLLFSVNWSESRAKVEFISFYFLKKYAIKLNGDKHLSSNNSVYSTWLKKKKRPYFFFLLLLLFYKVTVDGGVITGACVMM